MSEMLTIQEIEDRYAPDWVLVGDPRLDASLNLLGGRVLFHGPDQDEVCLKACEYPPGEYALRYPGEIPDDLVLVL